MYVCLETYAAGVGARVPPVALDVVGVDDVRRVDGDQVSDRGVVVYLWGAQNTRDGGSGLSTPKRYRARVEAR